MSATTPLVSDYPVDIKEPVDSGLPTYRINEDAEQLAVGGAGRPCFWSRFCHRRGAACGEATEERQQRKRNCARRIVRSILAFVLVWSVAHYFFRPHMSGCMKPKAPVAHCTPIEESGTQHHEMPIEHLWTHIGLHDSMNGGDVRITHSDEVEEGHVKFTFTVPEDVDLVDKDDDLPLYYACNVHTQRFVGFGLHPKDKHAAGIKSVSTVVTLSSKEEGHARGVRIMGAHHKEGGHHRFLRKLHRKFGMHRRIRKAIRKAIKEATEYAELLRHHKQDSEYVMVEAEDVTQD